MKNIFRITVVLYIVLFGVYKLFADSPITSTSFCTAYSENTIVAKAQKAGVIDESIANYLLNDSTAIDVKAAVINALSWSFDGKKNASLLMPYIKKKYKVSNDPDINSLSADDIFCLGYLTVMDNYFQTDESLKLLSIARSKKPKSYTINIILALVEAQKAMDTDWCRVYKVCEEVERNKDMKQTAIKIIFEYINSSLIFQQAILPNHIASR